MIGRFIVMAAGAGIFMASLILGIFSVGLRRPQGLWGLVPGVIGLAVCLFERNRIRATPMDAARPGIVPGDE